MPAADVPPNDVATAFNSVSMLATRTGTFGLQVIGAVVAVAPAAVVMVNRNVPPVIVPVNVKVCTALMPELPGVVVLTVTVPPPRRAVAFTVMSGRAIPPSWFLNATAKFAFNVTGPRQLTSPPRIARGAEPKVLLPVPLRIKRVSHLQVAGDRRRMRHGQRHFSRGSAIDGEGGRLRTP